MSKGFISYFIGAVLIIGTLITCEKPERLVKLSTSDPVDSDLTFTTAILKGEIIDLGSEESVNYGFIYSTYNSPENPNNVIMDMGNTAAKISFQKDLYGLKDNTDYYFWAYATSSKSVTYSEIKSFKTKSYNVPTVTTSEVSSVTASSAISGGNVINDGGKYVSARGICWSISLNPTVADSKTTNGNNIGTFTSDISGLSTGTTYHVRAYATNLVGTGYGSDVTFTTDIIVVPPTVTTTDITAKGTTTATGGGNVTAIGGATVTTRGVCWSTSENPTVSNSKTTNGSGSGIFTSSITGLTPATVYHVRAYATNSSGTGYGSDVVFTTNAVVLPTLTTMAVTSVTSSTAVSGGNITADGGATVTSRGLCWSTNLNPTTSDSKVVNGSTGVGQYSSNITGLSGGTTYHARAYATNSAGTAYGSDIEFTTNAATAPVLTTSAVSSITTTSATSGGNITNSGGAAVTVSGICWSTAANPTISDSKTTNGTLSGAFSGAMTGLTPATQYHVRAYATNSVGTGYGSDISFTTNPVTVPTVTTSTTTSIGPTTATSGGNVTADGGATVTERGVCWGAAVNPTTANSKVSNGTGTGSYTALLNGLNPQTTYHVRAYATNSQGTSYGSDLSFTTTAATIPTITTTTPSGIASNSAISGGNVTTDGGAPVTSRGVCWSTTQNPTLSNSYINEGTGTGLFTCTLISLEPGTTYYIRSFATNSLGTSYGDQKSFKTLFALPVVTTKDVSNISAVGGISGGIITSTGGGTISAKGICWGEMPNPTLSDNVINNGTGPTSFNSSIVAAVPGTTNYVRAFVTNEAGTSYGDQKTFTTLSNVNYYSFESGMLPVGWSGQWTVTNSYAFVGSYCLASLHGVNSETSLTITLANPGQISFYYLLFASTASGFTVTTYIDFYVDNVKVGTFPSTGTWNQGLFDVTAGTHTFKWAFRAAYTDGQAFIDHIVFPQK